MKGLFHRKRRFGRSVRVTAGFARTVRLALLDLGFAAKEFARPKPPFVTPGNRRRSSGGGAEWG